MRFLVDNQLPVALSQFLTSRGCDCQHVVEAGLAAASDGEIWRHAHETERIVISKDEDFLYLARRAETKAALCG